MVELQLDTAKDRLKALHRINILDTATEDDYDEITRLAAYICRTPVAYISFIDDERQWLKSKVGTGIENIPIEISFCVYAIQEPATIMIVPDATKDERFKDNPQTKTDDPVIFCASMPLVSDGVAIGSLCVIDHQPRQIKPEQIKALIFLAKCITDKLDERKNTIYKKQLQTELENEIELLYKAINSSSDHFFIIDPYTMRFINFNETAVKELGYSRSELFHMEAHEIKPLFTKDLLQKKYFEVINSPGKKSVIQTLHKKKNGEIIDVEVCFNSIRHNDKDVIISAARNVTEKINSQKRLIESEQKYRTLFDSLPDIVFRSDDTGKITMISPACLDILGYLPEELLSKPAMIIYNDPSECDRMFNNLKRKNVLKNYRAKLKCKKGDIKTVSINATGIYKNGKYAGIEGVASDITEAAKAEEEIIRTKDFYETILNSIPEDIAVFDHEGTYLFLNKTAIKDDNVRRWMIGKNDFDYCIERGKDISIAKERFQKHKLVNETGQRVEWMEKLTDKQGNTKYILNNIQPFFGNDGKAYKVGFGHDVTRLKTIEHQLIERKKYLRSLIISMPDLLFRMDKNGRILDYKSDSKNLLAMEPEKFLDKTMHEIFPKETADFHMNHVQEALQTGKMITYEYEMTMMNGEIKYFEARINKKEIDEVIIIARDITERKKSEITIIKREKQLNDAQQIAKVGSYERNIHTGILVCSDEFLHILGIEKKDNILTTEEYLQLVHPDDLEHVLTRRDRLLENETLAPTDYRIITPAGEMKYISSRTIEMEGIQKDKSVVFGTIQDITERVMFDKKLYRAVIESEEKERKRIAGELHDGVLQYLAAGKLGVETARNMLPPGSDSVYSLLEHTKNLLVNSLDITRKVSHDLMPATLYEEGFCKAVQLLADNLNKVDTIKYRTHINCEIKEPDPLVSVNLFRVIQEFTRNSQKYSDAQNIDIAINYANNHLELLIADNGKGYNMTERKKNGIGILNMVKRIETIGGTYHYDTAPGKGVKLEVKVPV